MALALLDLQEILVRRGRLGLLGQQVDLLVLLVVLGLQARQEVLVLLVLLGLRDKVMVY